MEMDGSWYIYALSSLEPLFLVSMTDTGRQVIGLHIREDHDLADILQRLESGDLPANSAGRDVEPDILEEFTTGWADMMQKKEDKKQKDGPPKKRGGGPKKEVREGSPPWKIHIRSDLQSIRDGVRRQAQSKNSSYAGMGSKEALWKALSILEVLACPTCGLCWWGSEGIKVYSSTGLSVRVTDGDSAGVTDQLPKTRAQSSIGFFAPSSLQHLFGRGHHTTY
jgi:hypothetical protein